VFRDRQRKEAEVDVPKPGTILVATQVVEVSLDISYDVLFTEVAPLDALVQRMGRVNRKGDAPPASVIVFLRWSEWAERIYGKDILSKSRTILKGLPQEPTDRDLAEATNKLYQQITKESEYWEELKEGQEVLNHIQKTLGCYTIDLSDEDLRTKFVTRRGLFSIDTLPAQFQEEAHKLIETKEKWRLVELLVPVPVSWFHAYPDWFSKSVEFGVPLTFLPYDPDLGLQPPREDERPKGYEII